MRNGWVRDGVVGEVGWCKRWDGPEYGGRGGIASCGARDRELPWGELEEGRGGRGRDYKLGCVGVWQRFGEDGSAGRERRGDSWSIYFTGWHVNCMIGGEGEYWTVRGLGGWMN